MAAAGSLALIFIIGALVLVAGPGFAGPPQSYDSVVVGKGDPTYDVKAVQDAVDQGGAVLLKGTFDFDDKGRVNIKNDVKVFGEIDKQGTRDEEYLFKSRNGNNKPLARETVNKMIKEWTKSFKGNYGTHTLRKTFGFIQRTKYEVSFEVLCKRFGHSSPSITMRKLMGYS